jgi:ribonuclease P protein subunit RPR2
MTKRIANRRKKPKHQKDIAIERIKRLFSSAEKAFSEKPELSHRYVEIARKISMRYNIPIPKELKRKFCKKCYKYIVPGKNCRVRTNVSKQAVIVKCLECGHVMRYPYIKEKKEAKNDKGKQ